MTKLKKYYLYFSIFMIIYLEFGYKMVVANQIPGFNRMILLILLSLPLLLYKKAVSKESLIVFLIITVYILINLLIDNNTMDYIMLIIPIGIGFIIANFVEFKDYAKIFCNIIYFFSVYSLIVYCINLLFPSVINSLPYVGNVYTFSAEIHDAIFAVAISNSEVIRNYGIAWEPGAFSLLVCFSLFLELSIFQFVNYKRVIILLVTIVTTFSTTGYIASFGILYATLLYRHKISNKEKKFLLFISLIIGLFICFVPQNVYDLVFSKLNGLFNGGEVELAYTTYTRVNAIKYPTIAFFSSPVFGVGYEKFSEINKVFCDGFATNTILNWYSILGIIFGLPCSVGLFRFFCKVAKKIDVSKLNALIICITFILILSTESLLRISFVYIFVFLGLQKNLYKKLNAIER